MAKIIMIQGTCSNAGKSLLCAALCRIFRQHTGMTIVSYLQELRCAQAAALIQEGTSLRRAAELSGFQDYNYFSRIFKKRTGRSPLSLTKEGRP